MDRTRDHHRGRATSPDSRWLPILALVAAFGLLAGCGSDKPEAKTTAGKKAVNSLSGSFCDKAKQLDQSDLFSDMGRTTDTSPEGQLKAMKGVYGDLAAAYAQLESGAPAKIKGDIAYFADAMKTANEQAQKATSMQDLSKLAGLTNLSAGEGKKHSDNLEAYLKDECGLDSGSSTSAAS